MKNWNELDNIEKADIRWEHSITYPEKRNAGEKELKKYYEREGRTVNVILVESDAEYFAFKGLIRSIGIHSIHKLRLEEAETLEKQINERERMFKLRNEKLE